MQISNRSEGGTARPALHPEGEGNAHRTPAIKLWGPQEAGEGEGTGVSPFPKGRPSSM
jgi:hypothetical protein